MTVVCHSLLTKLSIGGGAILTKNSDYANLVEAQGSKLFFTALLGEGRVSGPVDREFHLLGDEVPKGFPKDVL